MEKNLVLEDNKGKVVRVFNWSGDKATVIRREDTKRLEVVENLDFYFDNKIDFVELGQVSGDSFESQNKKAEDLALGQYGRLALIPKVESHYKNEEASEERKRLWLLTLLLVMFLFIIIGALMRLAPQTAVQAEEEFSQQVVKIVKNIQQEVPVAQTKVTQMREVEPTQAKVSPSKIAGLKRMGALSVLGSLNSGKNKGGLDISAAQSSAGPGMGGGTEGSGGVQTSLYAKGITSAALGSGNNVNGGGGYGTKGKGGGQAGYGKLALTGSTGATPMPLGHEADVAQGLDRDQIAAVINRNIGQVTYCYEQGLKDSPGIQGRIAIAFVIGGTGSVKSAHVDSSSLNSKTVEDCIVMRLKTWKFPVPEGGVDVNVKYPFKLERTGQG